MSGPPSLMFDSLAESIINRLLIDDRVYAWNPTMPPVPLEEGVGFREGSPEAIH